MIELIKRENCLITREKNIEDLFTFKNFPVFISCTDGNSQDDIFCDMKWGISQNGTIQLKELIPLDILYKNHHNSGLVGNLWKSHHNTLFQFISKRDFKDVLEIGGASGTLSSKFNNLEREYVWTNIEPGNYENKNSKVNVINSYFEEYNFNKKYDTIVHSHVFEHVYDPIKFLKKINSILTDDGLHYISIPNMKHWLSNGYPNTLMFEHTFYVDENILECMLNLTGFSIVDKFVTNHSIFVCCKKSQLLTETAVCNTREIKETFSTYVEKLKKEVNFIVDKVKDKKVYIFGAHIFTQIIINLGLNSDKIISILDNDLFKKGKRLYGTNIYVDSPSILEKVNSPIVICRCGIYTEEIKNDLLSINSSIQFI